MQSIGITCHSYGVSIIQKVTMFYKHCTPYGVSLTLMEHYVLKTLHSSQSCLILSIFDVVKTPLLQQHFTAKPSLFFVPLV